MREMAIPSKNRKKPKERWIDLVRKDMEKVGLRKKNKVDGALKKKLSRCSNLK